MPGLNATQRASYKAIGDRSKRVALQSAVQTTDTLGGVSESWVEYGQAWGAVSASPFVVNEAQAAVLYVVEIPYRDDVDKGDRVVVGDMTLKVLAIVNPELRNKALQLHCGEAN